MSIRKAKPWVEFAAGVIVVLTPFFAWWVANATTQAVYGQRIETLERDGDRKEKRDERLEEKVDNLRYDMGRVKQALGIKENP